MDRQTEPERAGEREREREIGTETEVCKLVQNMIRLKRRENRI